MKFNCKSFFAILCALMLLTGNVSACSIYKIVLTGGNCAGKSSCIAPLKEHFETRGYNVKVVNEVATAMYFNEGITAENSVSRYEYQKEIARRQLEQEEEAYLSVIGLKNGRDSLIICDRGLLDGQAFMDDCAFFNILRELALRKECIYDRYSAVFHLRSVAQYDRTLYGVENNPARKERLEQALLVDERLINIWSPHRYYRIIDNFPTFDEKVQKLIFEIEKFVLQFGEKHEQ